MPGSEEERGIRSTPVDAGESRSSKFADHDPGTEAQSGREPRPSPAQGTGTAPLPIYVLITPARNEARFIENTIRSVVAQTVRPLKWIIVSDGSTDETDAIVKRYAADHPWIELLQMPERQERHFAGKARAFSAGYARLRHLDYEVVGNLDGDVTFDKEFFEFLLGKLRENPRLGVVGTRFREGSLKYDYRFTSIEHVSGPCQVFRRRCFEEVGGYEPRRIGGIDLVAGIKARMYGWQTRTFLEKSYLHHRQMGTGMHRGFIVPFRVGQADYILGSHPLWHFSRCIYQLTRRPILLSGILRGAGFLWAMASGAQIEVPEDVVRFRRAEQMHRLRKFVAGVAGGSLPKEGSSESRVDSLTHLGPANPGVQKEVAHPEGFVSRPL